MLELEEAVSRILATIPTPVAETIPITEAHRRYLCESIISSIDLPLFDNSAMDGYAVQARDVANASSDAPARLKIIGKVAAGDPLGPEVKPGTAVRLFTGSPLPKNADAVVMQEDTRIEATDSNELLVLDSCKPWENARLQGEDIRAGTNLAKAGACLGVGHLALLAATGTAHVKVSRQPVLGFISTGSELRNPGEQLGAGQIYESNQIALAALSRDIGAIPKMFPLVSDDLETTRKALEIAFNDTDIVITSGGVSVGEKDYVKQALTDIGGDIQFWKVAIRPGRPFVFGRWKNKFLFGVPGNPVSALVTFLLLVRPALLRWQGASDTGMRTFNGTLAEPLNNPADRRHFLRVNHAADGKVYSSGTQASHMLSSLAAANGLVDLPPKTNLAAGTAVPVLRWD